jgi:hypothetical protein
MSSYSTAIGPRLVIALTALVALALAAACAKRSTEPDARGTHTLSGRVRLVGFVVRSDGVVEGNRVVDDADGVPVELRSGPTTLTVTHTVDGVYRFPGLAPGAYRARSVVHGGVMDETADLTVKEGDLFSVDTIELRSQGDIHPAPNPSGTFVVVSFGIPDTQFVRLRIQDVRRNVVQSLFGQVLPMGRYEAAWTWRDFTGQPATDPCYWVTFESGADRRAHLLFR